MCKKIDKYLFAVISLVAIFGFFGIVFAIDSISTGFRVNPSSEKTVDAFSDCQKVVNGSANSYFIPTRTNAEWQAFQNNLPSGITLGSCSCSLPWGGVIANGNSVTAYNKESGSCGDNCISEERECIDGVLSGSYQHENCDSYVCRKCPSEWDTICGSYSGYGCSAWECRPTGPSCLGESCTNWYSIPLYCPCGDSCNPACP